MSFKLQRLESLIQEKIKLHTIYNNLDKTNLQKYVENASQLMTRIKTVDIQIMKPLNSRDVDFYIFDDSEHGLFSLPELHILDTDVEFLKQVLKLPDHNFSKEGWMVYKLISRIFIPGCGFSVTQPKVMAYFHSRNSQFDIIYGDQKFTVRFYTD